MKMLKKQVTSAVVLGLLCGAGTAQAAELYNKNGNKLSLNGKLDGLHYFSKDSSNDGDETYFRPYLIGEVQISEGVSGYGQWEYHFWARNPESSSSTGFTRYAFAGLKYKNLGSIDYGRNNGILYSVSGWTDVIPEFGGDSYNRSDNFMTQRGGGMLTWNNNDFFGLVDGLNIGIQYQGRNGGSAETNNGRGYRAQNGDGFGLAAIWTFDSGLSVGSAYSNSNRTSGQKLDGNGDKAEAWNVALKYEKYGMYLAALYAETRNMTPFGDFSVHAGSGDAGNEYSKAGFANKTQNVELVAQYYFDSGLMPSVAYIQSQGQHLQINGQSYGSETLVKYVDIAAAYVFNKNMKVYVDYKINLLKDDDFNKKLTNTSTDNIVAVAMMYKF